MELDLCGERTIEPPDAATLEALVEQYSARPDFFAILAGDDQVYMQTAGKAERGFVLEYRDGSPMTHFRCANEALALSAVVRTMTLYLVGDARWRRAHVWHSVLCP